MPASFLRAAVLGVASRVGLVKLPPEFPFTDSEELRAYQRRSLQDQLATFRSCGVKWYRVDVPADACPRCREHAGEEYRVFEAVFGATAPPFCPGCQCMIVSADNE